MKAESSLLTQLVERLKRIRGAWSASIERARRAWNAAKASDGEVTSSSKRVVARSDLENSDAEGMPFPSEFFRHPINHPLLLYDISFDDLNFGAKQEIEEQITLNLYVPLS